MARIKTEKNTTRKDVIVSKAAILFREKGFKAASMRDLAESVGVEAASLYNHIKSKTELLHELCFSVANRFLQKLDEIESTLFPYTTLFRSSEERRVGKECMFPFSIAHIHFFITIDHFNNMKTKYFFNFLNRRDRFRFYFI